MISADPACGNLLEMPTHDQCRAVVLVSGGLDSATVLALARADGFSCHALSIDYGQRHRAELERARLVCSALGAVEHRTVRVDLRAIGGSALTDVIDVPVHDDVSQIETGIPITYVPARNLTFLSLAIGFAEVAGASDVFIGVNAVDYSGYPDCRPEFIESFEGTARLATKAGVEGGEFTIHTPIIGMRKAEIITVGMKLGVPYELTLSCYAPDEDGRACGRCDSCLLRRQGFLDAGVVDPTIYAERS